MHQVGFLYKDYQDARSAKHNICWLNVYHWGVGLAVTGQICDTGQNVLQSSLQTGRQEVVSAAVTSTFSSLSHF
jgi:hypothetical protein